MDTIYAYIFPNTINNYILQKCAIRFGIHQSGAEVYQINQPCELLLMYLTHLRSALLRWIPGIITVICRRPSYKSLVIMALFTNLICGTPTPPVASVHRQIHNGYHRPLGGATLLQDNNQSVYKHTYSDKRRDVDKTMVWHYIMAWVVYGLTSL